MSPPRKVAAVPDFVEVVDTLARDKITGLRLEFHEFRTESRADAAQLRSELSAGLTSIMKRMDAEKDSNIKDLGAGKGLLITSGLAIIGLAFSFTTLVTQPLRDGEARLETAISAIRESESHKMLENTRAATVMGGLLNQAEANRKTIDDNMRVMQSMDAQTHAQAMSCERQAGRLEALQQVVRDIDSQGTRWREGKKSKSDEP